MCRWNGQTSAFRAILLLSPLGTSVARVVSTAAQSAWRLALAFAPFMKLATVEALDFVRIRFALVPVAGDTQGREGRSLSNFQQVLLRANGFLEIIQGNILKTCIRNGRDDGLVG